MPAALRARQGWHQGDPLLFVETPRGVVLATREQLRDILADQLNGGSLVAALLAERRAAAAADDAA